MNELRNSKSDDQLEELLMLTEQMQEELDQKDMTIRELKMQLDESLTLNERLNSENRAGNIQALKNDLRKTKELLQSEKEKTLTAKDMIEECRDKQLVHISLVGLPAAAEIRIGQFHIAAAFFDIYFSWCVFHR